MRTDHTASLDNREEALAREFVRELAYKNSYWIDWKKVHEEIVRQSSFLRADEMKQGILDGVAAWRDGAPTDDVSLMLVHVR